MASHPYKSLPDIAFWRRAVALPAPESIDPVGKFNLRISPTTKLATAGSCFAQHIARHLQNAGFNYYVAEAGHRILPEGVRRKNNYGIFSARYGNIYTARQLVQLLRRAYGEFSPGEGPWIERDGSVRDPFRPTVQPGGFISEFEMRTDRKQHLAAVRQMFETLDVFVFTLGLTECWRSTVDGAVFPLCPGVEGGAFDPRKYEFYNQDVTDVVSDMSEFVDALKSLNKNAELVLTVSPVPLVATAEPDTHVLTATTYSKAVLRVAADMLCRRYAHLHYFPSYEIITGAFNRGEYYAPDLRNINERGVSHVMRVFLDRATGGQAIALRTENADDRTREFLAKAQEVVDVECDEAALDRSTR
jgi:hypothetical protein